MKIARGSVLRKAIARSAACSKMRVSVQYYRDQLELRGHDDYGQIAFISDEGDDPPELRISAHGGYAKFVEENIVLLRDFLNTHYPPPRVKKATP